MLLLNGKRLTSSSCPFVIATGFSMNMFFQYKKEQMSSINIFPYNNIQNLKHCLNFRKRPLLGIKNNFINLKYELLFDVNIYQDDKQDLS